MPNATSVTMNDLLRAAERTLSETWGGRVQLTFREFLEGRQHVARLDIASSQAGLPQTAILKRRRIEADDWHTLDDAGNSLLREWVCLNFASDVCGAGRVAPRVYGGNIEGGFILLADLKEGATLQNVLRGDSPRKAESALLNYGETLGRLHAQTLGLTEAFAAQWRKLAPYEQGQPFDYLAFFPAILDTLQELVEVRPSAYHDATVAAGLLSQGEAFLVLHHGDPVPGNSWIDDSGRCTLLDFESGHFDHALLDAVNLRMGFPTEGMAFSSRIPRAAWRPAEAAYRTALATRCTEAADTQVYGPVFVAACAFWAMAFCGSWLPDVLADDLPEFKRTRLRQCAITRMEAFVEATHEFGGLPALGETFAALLVKLKSRWPPEAQELPLYSAFSGDAQNAITV